MAVARRKRIAALSVSAVLAAGLSACGVVSPDMTAVDYPPSDGSMLILDDVRALNVAILTLEDVDKGLVIGSVVNRGEEEQEVQLAIDGQEVFTGNVAPHESISLEDPQAVIDTVPAEPGSKTDAQLSVKGAGTQTEPVPVLDDTLPEYAEIINDNKALLFGNSDDADDADDAATGTDEDEA